MTFFETQVYALTSLGAGKKRGSVGLSVPYTEVSVQDDDGKMFGLVPKRSGKARRRGVAQGRAGEIAGGRVGSAMYSRIARTEGVSKTKAVDSGPPDVEVID